MAGATTGCIPLSQSRLALNLPATLPHLLRLAFAPQNSPQPFAARAERRSRLGEKKTTPLGFLGQHIRRLREEKGLSQEEFSGLANLDRAYYGGIERGERNVAALNLIKIALALGVEVGELFPPLPALRRS